MILIKIIYFLAIPWITGYLFLCLIGGRPSNRIVQGLYLVTSTGLGFGLTSIFFFLTLALFHSRFAFIPVELAFLIFLCIAHRTHPVRYHDPAVGVPASGGRPSRALLFLLVALLLVSSVSYLSQYLVAPHGQWDAWTIWNLRPKFIVRTDLLSTSLSRDLSNIHCQDYPMMLPGITARGWTITGYEATWIPALVSFIYFYSAAGLLFFSLALLKRSNQAMLGVAAFLITPDIISFSANQYADIPLGYYFLASISFFILYSAHQNRNFLYVSAVATGMAAWTKNEGLMFAGVFLFTRMIYLALKERRTLKTEFIRLSAGIFPFIVLVVLFKHMTGIPNMFLNQLGATTVLDRVTDLSRYRDTLFLMAQIFYQTLPSSNLPFLLPLYLFLTGGGRFDSRIRGICHTAFFIVLEMTAIYFFSFIIIYDLYQMQISVSYNRLLIQTWPVILLLFFLFANSTDSIQES